MKNLERQRNAKHKGRQYRELAVLVWKFESWRYLSAVSRVGGLFFGMQYGGNVLAAGGFSFGGGNDFGGRR